MASKKVDVATALGSIDLGGGAVEKKPAKEQPKGRTTGKTTNNSLLLNLGDSELKDYLKVVSGVMGCSMTEYVIGLIKEDKEKNKALYNQAVKLRDKANN